MYCRSMKINAAKYSFKAGTASLISSLSELKIPIRKCGATIMTVHMAAVYTKIITAIVPIACFTRFGRRAP